jgi:hypothetical protein
MKRRRQMVKRRLVFLAVGVTQVFAMVICLHVALDQGVWEGWIGAGSTALVALAMFVADPENK